MSNICSELQPLDRDLQNGDVEGKEVEAFRGRLGSEGDTWDAAGEDCDRDGDDLDRRFNTVTDGIKWDVNGILGDRRWDFFGSPED